MGKVLKGGVSYNKYIWNAGGDACGACQDLDGTEYDYEGDVPSAPHPNCKCSVDIVENNSDDDSGEGEDKGDTDKKGGNPNPKKDDKKDEPCDCLDDLFDEIDELLGDAESLQDEVASGSDNLMHYLNKNYIEPVKSTIEDCIDSLDEILGTVGDFISNYNDMKEANTIGADKYFHSKANCEGAQRGELGAEVAKGISDLRELTDAFKNIYFKGMSEAESAKDSADDQNANRYGREQDTKYPDYDCDDLVDIFRPNGLPERY